jgi:hypothetical protein
VLGVCGRRCTCIDERKSADDEPAIVRGDHHRGQAIATEHSSVKYGVHTAAAAEGAGTLGRPASNTSQAARGDRPRVKAQATHADCCIGAALMSCCVCLGCRGLLCLPLAWGASLSTIAAGAMAYICSQVRVARFLRSFRASGHHQLRAIQQAGLGPCTTCTREQKRRGICQGIQMEPPPRTLGG